MESNQFYFSIILVGYGKCNKNVIEIDLNIQHKQYQYRLDKVLLLCLAIILAWTVLQQPVRISVSNGYNFRNTRYFHIIVNTQQRDNIIMDIMPVDILWYWIHSTSVFTTIILAWIVLSSVIGWTKRQSYIQLFCFNIVINVRT